MKKEYKKPLIIVAGVFIAAALLFLAFYDSGSTTLEPETDPSQERLEQYNHSVEYNTEHFEEQSIVEYTPTQYYVLDSNGLDQVLGNKKEDVTYDDIRSAISRLDARDELKEIYTELANNLEKQYPNLDLRIWNENLKSLRIEELSDEGLRSLGQEYGAYSKNKNTIYVQKDYEYVEGTPEYVIITHEMTHPIRQAKIVIDDVIYVCAFTTDKQNYTMADETLTSILSLRSYDPDSAYIGYFIPSHMMEVMLECMDNYTLEDYINDDISYFITKLNEANGDNDAVKILCLMQLNRDDAVRDDIYYEQDQYYDLYDYVARMYYRKNLHSGMSSEEISAVKDQLVSRLMAEVPEEVASLVDVSHFDDYLVQYCSDNGIEYDAGSAN